MWGDDIFISYSREDGATYAPALANTLVGEKFACKFDQWGSEPGRALPASLVKALRRCGMLVVVGTEGAGRSENVRQEIHEFLGTKRIIIPIDVGGAIQSAVWWDEIRGLALSPEPVEALKTGEVDRAVLNRIKQSVHFWRRDQRLRMTAGLVGLLVAFLSVVALILGWQAARAEGRREQSVAEAVQAEALANRAEASAKAAREEFRSTSLLRAQALRGTTLPGHRWQALDALKAAAVIRPGPDLRSEFLRCLDLVDFRPLPGLTEHEGGNVEVPRGLGSGLFGYVTFAGTPSRLFIVSDEGRVGEMDPRKPPAFKVHDAIRGIKTPAAIGSDGAHLVACRSEGAGVMLWDLNGDRNVAELLGLIRCSREMSATPRARLYNQARGVHPSVLAGHRNVHHARQHPGDHRRRQVLRDGPLPALA